MNADQRHGGYLSEIIDREDRLFVKRAVTPIQNSSYLAHSNLLGSVKDGIVELQKKAEERPSFQQPLVPEIEEEEIVVSEYRPLSSDTYQEDQIADNVRIAEKRPNDRSFPSDKVLTNGDDADVRENEEQPTKSLENVLRKSQRSYELNEKNFEFVTKDKDSGSDAPKSILYDSKGLQGKDPTEDNEFQTEFSYERKIEGRRGEIRIKSNKKANGSIVESEDSDEKKLNKAQEDFSNVTQAKSVADSEQQQHQAQFIENSPIKKQVKKAQEDFSNVTQAKSVADSGQQHQAQPKENPVEKIGANVVQSASTESSGTSKQGKIGQTSMSLTTITPQSHTPDNTAASFLRTAMERLNAKPQERERSKETRLTIGNINIQITSSNPANNRNVRNAGTTSSVSGSPIDSSGWGIFDKTYHWKFRYVS